MKLTPPSSLSSLVLLALAVIALPMTAGLVIAGLQLRQLSSATDRIAEEGVGAVRKTQELFAQSEVVLRLAIQRLVIGTDTSLENYAVQDARLANIERELAGYRYMRNADADRALQQFGALREQARTQIHDGSAMQLEIESDFRRMRELADVVALRINEQIDDATAELRKSTRRTQELMFWGFVLLIPLAGAALLLFSFKVVRPLRQVDRAINELGSGALHRSIHVDGPQDIQKLGRQLEWLRLRLLELAQERNRFLRHMSHELKTPLANIREGTELLMDGAVGELHGGQREVTGILRENGLRLQRMIENLLSFSAWQTSSVGLEISEFKLRPLIKQIIENQQLTLLSQRVRLDVIVEDLTITADRGKMRLILENLLSNAIKYTPRSGTIHIRGRADNGDLVLEVADSGPGIPAEERQQVFEAFYTGKAPSGHIKGTGIGLSVVLEFVNAHGGRIEIVDGQWPGAHFRIRMPLRAAVEPLASAPRAPGSRAHAA